MTSRLTGDGGRRGAAAGGFPMRRETGGGGRRSSLRSRLLSVLVRSRDLDLERAGGEIRLRSGFDELSSFFLLAAPFSSFDFLRSPSLLVLTVVFLLLSSFFSVADEVESVFDLGPISFLARSTEILRPWRSVRCRCLMHSVASFEQDMVT